MSLIVNERYDRLKGKLSPTCWRGIKAKAEWERISLSAVVKEYPGLLPNKLRRLAASCFVETHREWLLARQMELQSMLRGVERGLTKVKR